MEFSIIGIITIFIAATIMLSIGTNILGSTQVAECDSLSGAGVVTAKTGATSATNSSGIIGQTDGVYTKTAKDLDANPTLNGVTYTVAKNQVTIGADTAWSKSCWEVQESTSSSYGLLVLIILIIAAVGVLGAIRLLGA